MIILTSTFSRQLITIRIIPVGNITLAGSTHRVPPPVSRAGLFDLVLAVFTGHEGGYAVACVATLVFGIPATCTIVETRVQPAQIVALVPNIALLTPKTKYVYRKTFQQI